MKYSRRDLVPWWISLGSLGYLLGGLAMLLGFVAFGRISGITFLGIPCDFPPDNVGTLLLQLVQIFFGLTGLALLLGHRAGVRMGLICGYLGLGIRLTHDAAITSSLQAILQFDTFLRICFIVTLNQMRRDWEKAPPFSWRDFCRELVYGPPEDEAVPAQRAGK